MEYTGERMVPESCESSTFWEHIYRYRFACEEAKGNAVLDIACGEGYGSAALLKAGARSVVGIDVDASACTHAINKYGIDARVGRGERIPLPSKSIDLVVSFETIEHLSNPCDLLDESVRVLKDNGTLIISTPTRSNQSGPSENPFHLRELTEEEFSMELRKRFCSVTIFAQHPKRVRWWHLASLSSEGSGWNRMWGLRTVLRAIRLICCPEIVRPQELKKARLDPVSTIHTGNRLLSSLCNPFAIVKRRRRDPYEPAYVIGVASIPVLPS